MLKIAIIGRPNVGKSTLFNRLAGKKLAVTGDMPGVTRDRHYAEGSIGPLEFRMVDTAGLEKDFSNDTAEKSFAQTGKALAEADLALFLIDARDGITPLDSHFAAWLKKKNRPVLLVANKAEGRIDGGVLAESHVLGFGEPVTISAEHGEGLMELFERIEDFRTKMQIAWMEKAPEGEKLLRITIAGRPNSGKSTLLNAIAGEERTVTGAEAGTTRDSISISAEYGGKKFEIVDTAGLRKKSNITGQVEKTSASQTLRSIKYANVVILVLDATLNLEKQDLSIADLVLQEGRALVIAVNKWDLIEDHSGFKSEIEYRLEQSLSQVKKLPLIFISAKIGKNIDKLIKACFATFEMWNTEISTGQLNRWLARAVESHTPPMVKGRRIKLRYMTQTSTRPPAFVIFVSNSADFPESYLRYLSNSLKEEFVLEGITIRINLKKNKNPFTESA